MKKHLSKLIIIALVVYLQGCTKEEKNDGLICASRFYFGGTWGVGSATTITDTSVSAITSYIEGGKRVFRWSIPIANVCARDTVEISVGASSIPFMDFPQSIQTRARVEWRGLMVVIPITTSKDQHRGEIKIFMLPEFKDRAGSFKAYIELYFDRKGSFQNDAAFVYDNIFSVGIGGSYTPVL